MSVNAQPIAGNDAFTVTGNVSILVPDGASDLLANDFDPDTNSGAALTMVSTNVTSANCLVATCPANNVLISANGSFTYNPPPGYEGTDTFTYTVRDNGPDGTGGNADDATATGTVTLTISGMVWFINNGAAACTTQAAGCGRLSNPFSTLAAFQVLNSGATGTSVNPAINDNIFVYEKARDLHRGYRRLTLLAGQKLIGQDSTSTLAAITSITLPTFSTAFPAMIPAAPATTIQNATAAGNGVTLGSGNTLNGFTASNSSNFAILGLAFGTVTVNDVIVNTNTAGLSLTTGTFAGAGFSSFTSLAGLNNITLTGVVGTIGIGGGLMSGATGIGFNVSGGTATITNGAAISYTGANAAVSVSGGHATGTITFAGNMSATNGTGLQFDNADGTYNFNGSNTMNGGNAGIDIINGSAGAFSFSTNTAITNPAGQAYNEDTSTANVTYNGTISQNTANNAVNINAKTGGTTAFNRAAGGQITASTTTAGAIDLTNTGGTVTFTGGLAVTTTSGVGFNATGAGATVNTTQNNTTILNTITSTTGRP